ncbi:MAG: hypothetical protein KJ737_20185 [Proteobacteria bacterium]|nr:hypothetical protein [Pseudomonadota bacterium]
MADATVWAIIFETYFGVQFFISRCIGNNSPVIDHFELTGFKYLPGFRALENKIQFFAPVES